MPQPPSHHRLFRLCPLRVGPQGRLEVSRSCPRSTPFHSVSEEETNNMTSMDQDRWTRVKERLRAEVGDDVYSSWFARMELDGNEADTVKLSVPTRFLKSWIQSHYAER